MGAIQVNGRELLERAEQALDRGDSERAFEDSVRAAHLGVDSELLQRLAKAYGRAARHMNRQSDALAWIEDKLGSTSDQLHRTMFLVARIAVCRQSDVRRVLDLAPEALAAAEGASDEQAYARVLSDAAFAAYRIGERRTASQYAERAAERDFAGKLARFYACRAQLFAATARGEPERCLRMSRRARALALDLAQHDDAANEANNVAEILLELGRPEEAYDEAVVAQDLAVRSGHRQAGVYARVLMGIATAERGQLDSGLELLEAVESMSVNRIQAVDAAAAAAFWLLERGASGDAERAGQVAASALEVAGSTGASRELTTLWSHCARSAARCGRPDEARRALEEARRALERTEPASESQLALAFAEVLPVGDPGRRAALTRARSRILRGASRLENPRQYCVNVRVHRRLLELSGGVPVDLIH